MNPRSRAAKSCALLLLALLFCCNLYSQTYDVHDNPFFTGSIPKDSVFWQKMTVEQMLCLPPAYTVLTCSIRFKPAKGAGLFYVGYLRGNPQTCAGNFNAVRWWGRTAKPGDTMLISDIYAMKDGRKIKLAGKAILFK